jgi:phosphatidylserine decarboxylase
VSGTFPIRYFDRQSAVTRCERTYARGFLSWSYNTRTGRVMTNLLFRQPFVSRLYGWYHRQRWSRRRIRRFAEATDVNVAESLRPLEAFTSFNDFFTRDIDLTRRPIASSPSVCICPADGKLLAFPQVAADREFRIKGGRFALGSLLNDATLAGEFANGPMVIIRLHLADYHHFHFPDSGVAGPTRSIPGRLYAVGPYAMRLPVPFYGENHRMVTLLESEHFGAIAMIEIGAFTVGSIQQRFRPGERVLKGQRKGYFELGGSTVVLLFRKGAIDLDADLCEKTREGLETYVRLGDSIGRRRRQGDSA